MKRLATLLFAIAMLAAACSSAPSESVDQTSSSAAGQSDTTTATDAPDAGSDSTAGSTSGSTSGSTETTDATAPKPEGPVAPNFTLALATGDDFVLADAAKPVYMVFWAEW